LEFVIFIFFSAGSILSAILAVEHKEIVYAAFSFGFTSAYVAGLFLLLNALYLAVIQLAVFTGAISVLIIFGVLLIKREKGLSSEPIASLKRRVIGLLLASSIVLLAFIFIIQVPWPDAPPAGNIDLSSIQNLSLWLWGMYALAVDLVGVFLFSSIIGSVALLKREKEEAVAQYRQATSSKGGE
jgi:NADH:ubiquinone oxidoreductase subunit 6 (subunit J)